MSDNKSQPSQNEEVDLGQLFNAIGRMFDRFFKFLGNIFKGLFSVIIYALKPVVNNIKIISIVVMAAVIVGFIADYFKSPVYYSDMLVRPYFDSKYQLANNIDYYNALIESSNYGELASVFDIDAIEAKELLSFEIEIGPETQNDLLREYDEYIRSIDSTLANDVTYDDYISNRDILAGTIFSIKAKSTKHDIFKSLESGFVETLENDYSRKLKRKRDSSLLVRVKGYQEEIHRIDSLQGIYLNIMKSESEDNKISISSSSLFPLMQERTKTREYDLFQEELAIREKARKLEETLIEESDYFDILSGFEEVGTKESELIDKYTIVFPILSVIVMALVLILSNLYKFIKEYE